MTSLSHLIFIIFQYILNKQQVLYSMYFICFKFSSTTSRLIYEKVSTKIDVIYTKTFGGKIWTNLHRVFPCNFFGKNLNNASRKNARQKIIKKHLVQKRVEG